MSKRKLFIDYDLTIVDSIAAFAKTYNSYYGHHDRFIPADPDKITSYDFKCICPLIENNDMKMAMWESELFFEFVDFIDSDTLPVLEKLNDAYELIICSIGTPKNIALKSFWLERHLPFINNYILINNGNCEMNKSIVNMHGAIQIDDIPSNLEGNSELKILFGKEFPWNRGWYGKRCENWKEVEMMLL